MISHVIILHLHELTLKGKNRTWFENILINNIKSHLNQLPYSKIKLIAARIIILDIDINLWDKYKKTIKGIIGIRNFLLAKKLPLDIDEIMKECLLICQNKKDTNSFRISSRRQNKSFKYNKNEINTIVGEHVQKNIELSVKLKNPDLNIIVEIVNNDVYVGYKKIDAFGGLPVGTGEKALSLISSGIDSPVASFNIIKRGVELDYIHFHSSPTTSRQSIYNVISILKVLSRYQLNCKLYLFPLLEIQNKIMESVDSKYWVILFRRSMIKIANEIAMNNNYKVLISGENIGQVASQTLSNIVVIQDSSRLPIIRPLAGHNKEDIVNQAQQIGTYNISIEPYEDCCSYFVPPNPETKAHLDRIKYIEEKIELNNIINKHIKRAYQSNSNLSKIEIKEIRYE